MTLSYRTDCPYIADAPLCRAVTNRGLDDRGQWTFSKRSLAPLSQVETIKACLSLTPECANSP